MPYVLKKVAWCESKGLQFKSDGSLLRGKLTPDDVGRYQINEWYHLEDSKKLGVDIHTLEGNTEYALYLYRNYGLDPWVHSEHCWSDTTISDEVWNERLSEWGLLE